MTLVDWTNSKNPPDGDKPWWGRRRKRQRVVELRKRDYALAVSVIMITGPVATHPKFGGRKYAYGGDRNNWKFRSTLSMSGTSHVTPELLEEMAVVLREGQREALGLLKIWQLEGKPQFYYNRV